MNDNEFQEFYEYYKNLPKEVIPFANGVIISDKMSKLLPLFKQFSHKNISEEELIYELRKLIEL